ncbi:MAG: hypothetical protein S4CHLAM7_03840 [Chlamydiae bacterium]|nr:hypothetical protein [Chlamydiota bacterium]
MLSTSWPPQAIKSQEPPQSSPARNYLDKNPGRTKRIAKQFDVKSDSNSTSSSSKSDTNDNLEIHNFSIISSLFKEKETDSSVSLESSIHSSEENKWADLNDFITDLEQPSQPPPTPIKPPPQAINPLLDPKTSSLRNPSPTPPRSAEALYTPPSLPPISTEPLPLQTPKTPSPSTTPPNATKGRGTWKLPPLSIKSLSLGLTSVYVMSHLVESVTRLYLECSNPEPSPLTFYDSWVMGRTTVPPASFSDCMFN